MNRESFKKLQKDRITERVYNDWGGWEKSLKGNCVLTLVPSLAVQYYPRVKYCTANEETHQNNEGGLSPPPTKDSRYPNCGDGQLRFFSRFCAIARKPYRAEL